MGQLAIPPGLPCPLWEQQPLLQSWHSHPSVWISPAPSSQLAGLQTNRMINPLELLLFAPPWKTMALEVGFWIHDWHSQHLLIRCSRFMTDHNTHTVNSTPERNFHFLIHSSTQSVAMQAAPAMPSGATVTALVGAQYHTICYTEFSIKPETCANTLPPSSNSKLLPSC